ncbi:MAG TPA: phosphoribosyltransferase family protein [Acidobacteriota bacterium]|nr:phosphoribosyltransferase family protein [Acidobacteriota bacterium]
MKFKDRADAGRQLANLLERFKGQDVVVYALPRGGVVLGYEIARTLHAPLDCVIARKISHPADSEYAIAAISEHGDVVVNKKEPVDPVWLASAGKKQLVEAKRRRDVYCNGKSVSAHAKIAVVVDDGIATGLTLRAALLSLRKQKPQKIIVAVPVISKDMRGELSKSVDEIVAVQVIEEPVAYVGMSYEDFSEVTDSQVVTLIGTLVRGGHSQ